MWEVEEMRELSASIIEHMTILTLDQQVALLMQGTEYGDENLARTMAAELRAKLAEGRPLRVYCGYDPRTADLHLGHTITMRKLRQFQELGHEVTFLIGSYTSLVGDPSDKDKTRPVMTIDDVNHNSETYADQAARILDMSKTKLVHNGHWLADLKLLDMIKLGQNFTFQQFLDRENFAKRFEKGEPIFLHETFYALMQGYDAVVQNTDVQVGGTDQLFNIITAGRKLQEAFGQKPQVGIIMGILPGTDGVVKMSKSLGNHIPLNTTAEDMYGKVMSLPDMAMGKFFRLATRWTPETVAKVEASLRSGAHPRDIKMSLAWEITASFYGDAAADAAQTDFIRRHQEHKIPDDIQKIRYDEPKKLVYLLTDENIAKSGKEGRRLIEQGGVKMDGLPVTDTMAPMSASVIEIGKRRTFVKLSYNPAEVAVSDWLRSQFPNDKIQSGSLPDFIRTTHEDGQQIGYEVRYVNDAGQFTSRFSGLKRAVEDYMTKYSRMYLVLVADSPTTLDQLQVFLSRSEAGNSINFVVVVGLLVTQEDSSAYRSVFEIP